MPPSRLPCAFDHGFGSGVEPQLGLAIRLSASFSCRFPFPDSDAFRGFRTRPAVAGWRLWRS